MALLAAKPHVYLVALYPLHLGSSDSFASVNVPGAQTWHFEVSNNATAKNQHDPTVCWNRSTSCVRPK
eukprot:166489-Amphidinium_carterae.1